MLDIISPIFDWLYLNTGWNISIFRDEYDAIRFFGGVWTTIHMSILCIFLSLVIGALAALIQSSRLKVVVLLVNAYIEFFRNTPSFIQLYFFYFGFGPLFTYPNEFGQNVPIISNYTWAVICFSIYTGAFNTEIFRSGIEAISKSTVEAAESLGYTNISSYRHIILPIAIRVCFPALNNNLVNLIKLTAIAYAISVPEILYVSSQIWADALNVTEIMNVVLISYVLIVSVFVYCMNKIEKYLYVPGVGLSR